MMMMTTMFSTTATHHRNEFIAAIAVVTMLLAVQLVVLAWLAGPGAGAIHSVGIWIRTSSRLDALLSSTTNKAYLRKYSHYSPLPPSPLPP